MQPAGVSKKYLGTVYVMRRISPDGAPRQRSSMPNAESLADRSPQSTGFREPKPNAFLMWLLGYVNQWFLLQGLPGLRRLPLIREIPLIGGHFRIRAIDFPPTDRERLRSAVNESTAAFLGPNHPEFGLDWMMDKEISRLMAPRMASWASHGIVATAPGFWTSNNLVANNGGEAARQYSIACAKRGHGVLLHPEGSVHWTANKIQPLFHGIAEMAADAARELHTSGAARPVFIAPIVWKYRYTRDVSVNIHREMTTIEREMALDTGHGLSVAERFHLLQHNLLCRQMMEFGFDDPSELDFFSRQHAFRLHLVDDLASRYVIEASDSIERTLERLRRAITRERVHADGRVAAELERDLAKVEEASRLGGFSRDVYETPMLSQEQIFESLKRIRASLLRRGTANVLHNYLPTPYGPRVAHVRVPEPIAIDPHRACADAAERRAYVGWLIEETRSRMQHALDEINGEIADAVAALSHSNPFFAQSADHRRVVESSASSPCRIDSGTRNADPWRMPRGVFNESENGSQCSKSRVRTAP